MAIEQMRARVSNIAVAIFIMGVVTQCFSYYMSTVVAQQISSEIRNEIPAREMRQLDPGSGIISSTDHSEIRDDLYNMVTNLSVLAAICAAGYYGAKQNRTDWMCCFSICNGCSCMCNACILCALAIIIMGAAALVANLTPVLRHCDAYELCPLTEDARPDANGNVADRHAVDCLAKGMWPAYHRAYPEFGVPLGPRCGFSSRRTGGGGGRQGGGGGDNSAPLTILFLNCTANNNHMTMLEAAEHEDAFRSELVEWPAHVLAENTMDFERRFPGEQAGGRGAPAPNRRIAPRMPSNVLEDCRANRPMMEGFHHAKTLVPEIWATLSVELRIMQFLYFVTGTLALLGFMWGWQLRNMVNRQIAEGGYHRQGAPPSASYAQPLLNVEYAPVRVQQPWEQPDNNVSAGAAYTRPQVQQPWEQPNNNLSAGAAYTRPQAPQQVVPQQAMPVAQAMPANQFVITCPEFTRQGQTISVRNPATGQMVEVEVPEGVNPGMQFAVAV